MSISPSLLPTTLPRLLLLINPHLFPSSIRVSQEPDLQMTVDNLARVFGPTLIGYSTKDPEPLQMLNETPVQVMVSVR